MKEAVEGVEVLPWGELTTGRPEVGVADGELGAVDVGEVVLRWTIGVVAAGGVSEEAAALGRSAAPSVGASLTGAGSVPRETAAVGDDSSPVARRETVGPDGLGATAIGIAAGGVASVAVGVPGAPPSSKGTVVAAPRVGAWSSAILLSVGPTGNDLGEAGAAICSVTAGGSGAGVTSTADEIMGGPSPPRRRAGVAAGASTRGIAGASVERWTIGAPMGVAPVELGTEVTASPEEPKVGDSGAGASTGSGSTGASGGSGEGTAAGAGAASTTGRLHGSGVSTEPGPPLSEGAGPTDRSTGVGDGSNHR